MNQEPPELVVDAITVRFGAWTALDCITLQLDRFGVTAIVGPNGSGKSTLLDVISGFVTPTSGVIRSASGPQLHARQLAKLVARLHQRDTTPHALSVEQFLAVAHDPDWASSLILKARPRHFDASQLPPFVRPLLQQAGLRTLGMSIGDLSGGQRRVVALIASLVAPKQVVLLDEPFAGVAADVIPAIVDAIERQAVSRPIVVADHRVLVLGQFATRFHLLRRGRLIRSSVSLDELAPLLREGQHES